jgi:integrase
LDKTSETEERVDVRGDGRIILYKREGLKKPKWQARIRVPNATGYKVVTTKTADLNEARVFATNLYEKLYFDVKAGGTLSSKTFKQTFDEWEKSLKTQGHTRQGGSWDDTIARVKAYALNYFGQKRMSDLKSVDFIDYWLWRKTNYNRKPPSNGTLKRERTCLMPLLKFAKKRGYLTEIPEMEAPQSKTQRRSTFTDDEWKTFYTKARAWVKEAEKLATWRDRFIAQQYFLVLANTGLRVGEIRNLRWSDLRMMTIDDSKQMVAWVQGKTGAREVVFQPGADTYIRRIYDMRLEEVEGEVPRDSAVFCHPDGSAIQSFKNSFKSLMKFAEIPIVRNGMARTIYSLRHYYATKRLESETSPFLLAKQMGTSVEMLEKFYGQTSVNATTAKSVSKGNQKAGSNSKDSQYPFD